MAQSFQHVLRGFDAAEVEAYVAAHRVPWWKARELTISVQGDRIRASRGGGSLSSFPPVLRGTITPGPSGAVVEGDLTPHAGDRFLSASLWGAVVLMAVVAVAALLGDGPLWLVIGGLVAAGLLALVGRSRSRALQDPQVRTAEANELRGALNSFFGTPP